MAHWGFDLTEQYRRPLYRPRPQSPKPAHRRPKLLLRLLRRVR